MREKTEKRNIISLISKDAFSVLSQTFASFSIIQAYLMSRGFVSFQLGVLNAMTNVGLMLGMFLFMGKIDSIKPGRITTVNSRLFMAIAILPTTLIFISLSGIPFSNGAVFVILALVWAVHSFFSGLRTLTDIRVGRDVFNPETYGFAYGIDGMVFNFLGIVSALLIRQIIQGFDNGKGYGLVFVVALALVPGAVVFSGRLRLLREHPVVPDHAGNSPVRAFACIIKDKLLRNITYLHVVRGIINGMFIFMLPFGVSHYGIPLSYAAYFVIVNATAGILGYFFLNVFYDRIGTVLSIVIGTGICLLGLAGLIVFRNPLAFLLFLSLFLTGHTIIMQSVPMGIYMVVPVSLIGSLTGVRFIMMQTAEAVVALIMGIIIPDLSIPLFYAIVMAFLFLQLWLSRRCFSAQSQPL